MTRASFGPSSRSLSSACLVAALTVRQTRSVILHISLTFSAGVGDALKKLGFKVYDFQAASDRYERDFPLWLEAMRLRVTKQAYNKSDYDKVIGDYNALVGVPASLFDLELIRLYPNVKIISMTRRSDYAFLRELAGRITSRFWQTIDPTYCGDLHRLLTVNAKPPQAVMAEVEEQHARALVKEKNLLEINNLLAWVPLCQFLCVPVPKEPAPELHDNTFQAVLAARPKHVLAEKRAKVSHLIKTAVKYTVISALVMSLALSAVPLGVWTLLKLLVISLQFYNLLIMHSQIRDVTRLSAVGVAISALVCGFIAGYIFASLRERQVPSTVSPGREHQHRYKNDRRKGKQSRDKRAENAENVRPERPTLYSWSGVQGNIRKDDAKMQTKGRAATFEEWKNGKHVTFHVTHKQTESGQDLFSGPRKILSVTEETVE